MSLHSGLRKTYRSAEGFSEGATDSAPEENSARASTTVTAELWYHRSMAGKQLPTGLHLFGPSPWTRHSQVGMPRVNFVHARRPGDGRVGTSATALSEVKPLRAYSAVGSGPAIAALQPASEERMNAA